MRAECVHMSPVLIQELFSDDLLVADKEEFPGVTPAEGVRMFPGFLDDRFFFTIEHQDLRFQSWENSDMGTADVLVGNRSGRLAQPWVIF